MSVRQTVVACPEVKVDFLFLSVCVCVCVVQRSTQRSSHPFVIGHQICVYVCELSVLGVALGVVCGDL